MYNATRFRSFGLAVGLVAGLLFAVSVFASSAHAQTTFTVTVADKTADHPYNGQGFPEGFVIDGDQGAELTLQRGETYEFQMSGVPTIHPFFITTSAEGGPGAPAWEDGVTGNNATGNETLTFTVPMDAPDELWYQCHNHSFMGYRLNITGGGTDVEEEGATPELELGASYPNPFRDRTTVLLTLNESRDVTAEAFDLAGRRVAVLHRGPLSANVVHPLFLEASELANGTYIVRVTAGEDVAEQQVTLAR
jgi:hypothetical protein